MFRPAMVVLLLVALMAGLAQGGCPSGSYKTNSRSGKDSCPTAISSSGWLRQSTYDCSCFLWWCSTCYRCDYCTYTPAPTRYPTRYPTRSPTKRPTKRPTFKPTPFPSARPSKTPTTAPTRSPSVSPTKAPTKSPTPSPTYGPTSAPTEAKGLCNRRIPLYDAEDVIENWDENFNKVLASCLAQIALAAFEDAGVAAYECVVQTLAAPSTPSFKALELDWPNGGDLRTECMTCVGRYARCLYDGCDCPGGRLLTKGCEKCSALKCEPDLFVCTGSNATGLPASAAAEVLPPPPDNLLFYVGIGCGGLFFIALTVSSVLLMKSSRGGKSKEVTKTKKAQMLAAFNETGSKVNMAKVRNIVDNPVEKVQAGNNLSGDLTGRSLVVTHPCVGQYSDELTLSIGQSVVVTEVIDDNWVRARDPNGREGLAPRNVFE